MKTMDFDEAFKEYSEDIKTYNRQLSKMLLGQRIIGFEYGLDADSDPEVYYMVLDNGIKIGMARVYPTGEVVELDRTERYRDESIIRFQFHNWPKEVDE